MGLMADVDRYIDKLIAADEAARRRKQKMCTHSWSSWQNVYNSKDEPVTFRRCYNCKLYEWQKDADHVVEVPG